MTVDKGRTVDNLDHESIDHVIDHVAVDDLGHVSIGNVVHHADYISIDHVDDL